MTQSAVRKIITDLGYTIEEISHSKNLTQCCGMGGMASSVDPAYSSAVAKRILKEVNRDLIVYCATCRANFSQQGTRVIHLLELLFNEDWENELAKLPLSKEREWVFGTAKTSTSNRPILIVNILTNILNHNEKFQSENKLKYRQFYTEF